MAGFGFRKKPSEGVGKPIAASCVVFDNTVTRVAMLAFDLCYVGKTQLDDLRAAAQKAKIPPQHLMVNFSHTHSGPNVTSKDNAAYAALFKTRSEGLFAAAVADLQPALLDYAVGSSTMAVNRRRLNEKRHLAEMLPEPRKAIDPDVPILRVSSPDGKVRAVLFGYACHPSTLADYRISPDYVGYARDWIAAVFPGCTPVFFQGCGGDIKARYVQGNGKFGFPGEFARARRVHRRVGTRTGPGGGGGARGAARAGAGRPVQGAARSSSSAIQLGGIVEEYNAPDKKQPDKVSRRKLTGTWRVGDVYFVGCQCEIGSQIGLHIKRAAGRKPGVDQRLHPPRHRLFHGRRLVSRRGIRDRLPRTSPRGRKRSSSPRSSARSAHCRRAGPAGARVPTRPELKDIVRSRGIHWISDAHIWKRKAVAARPRRAWSIHTARDHTAMN